MACRVEERLDNVIGIKYGIYWLPDNSDLLVIVICVLMIVGALIVGRPGRFLMVVVLLFLWEFPTEAADKPLPATAKQAPTQSECITAYMSYCSSVPFTETAIRACIMAHKPQCLGLIRGIK